MPNQIKVGFHVDNSGYLGIDTRFPERGNPGIGGTQFTAIALAYYLKQFYPDRIEPVIFADYTDLLPPSLSSCAVTSRVDAAIKASESGCDIFVFRSQDAHKKIYETVERLGLKSVARSNNTPGYEALTKMADARFIKSHVCVGQEQLDYLRDHRVIAKSTRIFHPFNPASFIPKPLEDKTSDTVVYLGSITPKKGFHNLARVWPKILQAHPAAKLSVIGSGKLYDRSSQLGTWGVAEERYEATEIRPYLSDEEGNIHPSVRFEGLLGDEKIPILQKATVGVVNPTGYTEVCCASSLEFQACGTPVVAGADWGLLDTIAHNKTGLLGKNDDELANNILYFLKHPDAAKAFGENGIKFVQESFSPEASAAQWMQLFENIMAGKSTPIPPVKSNLLHRGKILREGIRLVRTNIPFLQTIPSINEFKTVLKGRS